MSTDPTRPSGPSDCPGFDALVAHVGGHLPAHEVAAIDRHLGTCDACGLVVAEAGRALMSGSPEASTAEPNLAAIAHRTPEPKVGDALGRYRLLEELGRGAMGIVFSAYDPELDRRVAVKVVRPGRDELDARMLAEAQAMARLAHPNVVAVFDLGPVPAGGVYLAMELVPGQTLRAWLTAEPRRLRAIVDAFAQAGDGLAAAHAEGIVHRDFKPDNVLVDREGRVRVTDFGLARLGERARPAFDLEASDLRRSDLHRTRAGTVIGTPAYMAPEQLDGGPVDARADVFALGVSLYEALFGTRPYGGRTFGELELALRRGVPAEPPATRKVPRWLRRVVMRAVQGDPAARYPTMAALTAALRSDPRRKLVRIAAPIAATALAGGTIAVVLHLTTATARGCRAGAEVPLWPPSLQEAAEAAFDRSGKAFAPDAFRAASQALARHVESWRAARVEACDATHERGEQSEALLDLRLRCLDQRRAEIGALGGAFAAADATTVENAVEAVSRLPSPAICAELERLQARVPPPADPVAAAQVDRAEALLASAQAESSTGNWKTAADHAEQARQLAREAGYAPAEAEAQLVLGLTAVSLGEPNAALAHYLAAIPLAMRAGDDRLGASAASSYAAFLSVTTRSRDEPLRWTALAEAQAARVNGDDALVLDVLVARATILVDSLDAAGALADLEASVTRYGEDEERIGAPRLIDLLRLTANAYQQAERYADANRTFERARARSLDVLGPLHPKTVGLGLASGGCLASAGHYDAAEALLRQSLADAQRIYGTDNSDTATLRRLRAVALTGLGRFDEAASEHAIARAIELRLYGDNPGPAVIGASLAVYNLIRAGQGQRALVALSEAQAIAARHLADAPELATQLKLLEALAFEANDQGTEAAARFEALEEIAREVFPDGTELAWTLDGRGRALLRDGRAAESVRFHGEALAILERHYEPNSLELGPTLIDLARASCTLAQSDEARAVAARAESLHLAEQSDPLALAEARLVLATCGERDSERLEAALTVLRTSAYPRAKRILAQLGE